MIEVRRYMPTDCDVWNDFVAHSKQGTFLFDRQYMEYHADRFHDYSLMIYRKGKLYALLPANEVMEADGGKMLYSHQGLTYGGLITNEKATAVDICEVFRVVNIDLHQNGFSKVVYKPVPHIYHRNPAEEDLYALFKECHAHLSIRNIASSIELQHPVKWRYCRSYAANKAYTAGITVEPSTDVSTFWSILEDNLMRTYHATPVHSLEEMQLLKERFPEKIQLYIARKGDEVLAGTVLYMTPQVVHVQYISASEEGKRTHALDLLFRYLLNQASTKARYFDFGTSNEKQGHYLNENLIYQKEGFGGRGVCYDTYEWQL